VKVIELYLKPAWLLRASLVVVAGLEDNTLALYAEIYRMKIDVLLCVTCISLALTACGSPGVPNLQPDSERPVSSQSGTTRTTQVIDSAPPPPSSPAPSPTPPSVSDYNLEFRLVSDQLDDLLVVEPRPTVSYTLWAYDQLVADVSATEIKVVEFELRPQAASYLLQFNKEDLEAIELKSDVQDAVRYYVTMNVDVDGDGVSCNGDFRQNLDVARPEFFPLSRTVVDQVIEVAEISGEVCE